MVLIYEATGFHAGHLFADPGGTSMNSNIIQTVLTLHLILLFQEPYLAASAAKHACAIGAGAAVKPLWFPRRPEVVGFGLSEQHSRRKWVLWQSGGWEGAFSLYLFMFAMRWAAMETEFYLRKAVGILGSSGQGSLGQRRTRIYPLVLTSWAAKATSVRPAGS